MFSSLRYNDSEKRNLGLKRESVRQKGHKQTDRRKEIKTDRRKKMERRTERGIET